MGDQIGRLELLDTRPGRFRALQDGGEHVSRPLTGLVLRLRNLVHVDIELLTDFTSV